MLFKRRNKKIVLLLLSLFFTVPLFNLFGMAVTITRVKVIYDVICALIVTMNSNKFQNPQITTQDGIPTPTPIPKVSPNSKVFTSAQSILKNYASDHQYPQPEFVQNLEVDYKDHEQYKQNIAQAQTAEELNITVNPEFADYPKSITQEFTVDSIAIEKDKSITKIELQNILQDIPKFLEQNDQDSVDKLVSKCNNVLRAQLEELFYGNPKVQVKVSLTPTNSFNDQATKMLALHRENEFFNDAMAAVLQDPWAYPEKLRNQAFAFDSARRSALRLCCALVGNKPLSDLERFQYLQLLKNIYIPGTTGYNFKYEVYNRIQGIYFDSSGQPRTLNLAEYDQATAEKLIQQIGFFITTAFDHNGAIAVLEEYGQKFGIPQFKEYAAKLRKLEYVDQPFFFNLKHHHWPWQLTDRLDQAIINNPLNKDITQVIEHLKTGNFDKALTLRNKWLGKKGSEIMKQVYQSGLDLIIDKETGFVKIASNDPAIYELTDEQRKELLNDPESFTLYNKLLHLRAQKKNQLLELPEFKKLNIPKDPSKTVDFVLYKYMDGSADWRTQLNFACSLSTDSSNTEITEAYHTFFDKKGIFKAYPKDFVLAVNIPVINGISLEENTALRYVLNNLITLQATEENKKYLQFGVDQLKIAGDLPLEQRADYINQVDQIYQALRYKKADRSILEECDRLMRPGQIITESSQPLGQIQTKNPGNLRTTFNNYGTKILLPNGSDGIIELSKKAKKHKKQNKADNKQKRTGNSDNPHNSRRLTNKEARAKAKEWGYVEAKPDFDTRNQIAFRKGSSWITPDADGHNGGVWKEMDRSGDRIGTLDKNGNRIKG